MLTTRRHAIAFIVLGTALTLAGVWAILLGFAERLPDPIAVHWDDMDPDRGAAADDFGLLLSGFYLLGAGVGVAVALRSDLERRLNRRTLGAGFGYWSGIALGAGAGIVIANLDATRWQDARLSVGGLTLMVALNIALPAAGALLGFLTAGGRPDEPRPAPQAAPALDLPAGVRVAWSHRQSDSKALLAISAAVVMLIFVGLFTGEADAAEAVAVTIVLVAFTGLLLTGFAVTVGSKGVQVRFGVLRWPSWRIPLSDIESAYADVRGPADVGGWGFRIVPGRVTAVMTRNGECLILRRKGKREAVISVDDAGTAAAVLNTLVRRAPAAR